MTLPEFCQRNSRKLRHQFVRGVRNVESIAKDEFRPFSVARRDRGFLSFPNLTQYCASKHALLAIANGLRQEVAKDGVRVLSVLPGKVATPLLEAVRKEQGEDYIPENYVQPEDVAQVVLTALMLPDNATMTDVVVAPQGEVRKAGIQ